MNGAIYLCPKLKKYRLSNWQSIPKQYWGKQFETYPEAARFVESLARNNPRLRSWINAKGVS